MKSSTIVIVTGATSGIGLSTAIKLKELGYNVIATGRNMEKLILIKKKYGFNVCELDLSKIELIEEKIENIVKKYKRIDCLINCAGMGLFGKLENISDKDICECININLAGTILIEKYIAKSMVEHCSGHIITIESLASDNGIVYGEIYSATKAGISMFNRILEKQLREKNVKVTSIKPGLVNTKLINSIQGNDRTELYGLNVDEIVDTIIFILSQSTNSNISEIKIRPFDKKGQKQFQDLINTKFQE